MCFWETEITILLTASYILKKDPQMATFQIKNQARSQLLFLSTLSNSPELRYLLFYYGLNPSTPLNEKNNPVTPIHFSIRIEMSKNLISSMIVHFIIK